MTEERAVYVAGERRRFRLGDRVTVAARVRGHYTDADAARRKGDDRGRLVLELASGALWHVVRVVDVVPDATSVPHGPCLGWELHSAPGVGAASACVANLAPGSGDRVGA